MLLLLTGENWATNIPQQKQCSSPPLSSPADDFLVGKWASLWRRSVAVTCECQSGSLAWVTDDGTCEGFLTVTPLRPSVYNLPILDWAVPCKHALVTRQGSTIWEQHAQKIMCTFCQCNFFCCSFNKPTTVESGYSDTLWNLNFSRTVAGITKWFWITIERYLSYLLPTFEYFVPTSLGSGAI